jgi:hypothetical protein
MSWFSDGQGWLVIAGIIVLATLGLGPSVRIAERFRDEHFPPEPEDEEGDDADGDDAGNHRVVGDPAVG